ncbi:eukaryotic translation initiation factor 4 gamma 3-like [Sipha flava]|uniref:Eukaryotic translation initiation factor 4 gamma 3-like n=1 Tax=Sipha flava TaxID=143950 RepID=A0A8B8FAE7_9HEMI|nr:eukaryotic translation initiation factor 4 gamma 3-like [Sipha flava]
MNTFAKTNNSEALENQSRDMGAGENCYPRPVNGRRVTYPEQSSFPRAFGQRPTYQTGKPTFTPSAYNANKSTGKTNGKVINYYLSKNNEVKLQTCENAWVPRCLKQNIASGSPDGNSTEEIRKKFMAILNKISPENMNVLAESITSLPIDTDDKLKTVIDLLFQKAIVEPNFTPQYAYICTALDESFKKSENKKDKTTFIKLLTKCCKERFNAMKVHEQNLAKSLEVINQCKDQEVKSKLQSEYDQDEMVHRKKSVGNCRFMCELHKVHIISNGTLEECINYLLKCTNEETLECACNILKHAGKSLNTKVAFRKLEEYKSLVNKTKISSRIRFMILDIIELKENDWVPRNARTKPTLCPNKVVTSVRKTDYRPSTNVQYKPAVLPMDDKRVNTIGHNDSSSAMCVSDANNVKKSSVLACVRSDSSSTNTGIYYQSLKNENTGVQVTYIDGPRSICVT